MPVLHIQDYMNNTNGQELGGGMEVNIIKISMNVLKNKTFKTLEKSGPGFPFKWIPEF